jgi:hypothetical protein
MTTPESDRIRKNEWKTSHTFSKYGANNAWYRAHRVIFG